MRVANEPHSWQMDPRWWTVPILLDGEEPPEPDQSRGWYASLADRNESE